jgi:hypothetical protein
MAYEITGTPVVLIASAGVSTRVALPPLVDYLGALRLSFDKTAFFAFGDNTVVADDDADSSGVFVTSLTGGAIEYVRPLSGATHIAVLSADSLRVTITPIRTA